MLKMPMEPAELRFYKGRLDLRVHNIYYTPITKPFSKASHVELESNHWTIITMVTTNLYPYTLRLCSCTTTVSSIRKVPPTLMSRGYMERSMANVMCPATVVTCNLLPQNWTELVLMLLAATYSSTSHNVG
jgi:hypothetical protein